VAYVVQQAGIGFADPIGAAEIARQLQVRFVERAVLWDGSDITSAIRTEEVGNQASKIAAMTAVRAALLAWQREKACLPGLVADGRDMGTVVFPEAVLKVFLTASAEERAKRRYKQLEKQGIAANISALSATIQERDARDRNRRDSPLIPAADAVLIDSTGLSIEAVFHLILQAAQQKNIFR
jgi:cytidylate kinase